MSSDKKETALMFEVDADDLRRARRIIGGAIEEASDLWIQKHLITALTLEFKLVDARLLRQRQPALRAEPSRTRLCPLRSPTNQQNLGQKQTSLPFTNLGRAMYEPSIFIPLPSLALQ